jgi:hypothetical protein
MFFDTIDGLENRLANIEMWSFYQTIRARVVTANTNMIDVVSLCEVSESFEEGCTIICNDFAEGAPTT